MSISIELFLKGDISKDLPKSRCKNVSIKIRDFLKTQGVCFKLINGYTGDYYHNITKRDEKNLPTLFDIFGIATKSGTKFGTREALKRFKEKNKKEK